MDINQDRQLYCHGKLGMICVTHTFYKFGNCCTESLHNFLLLNIDLIPKLREDCHFLSEETIKINAWVLKSTEE